MEAKAYTQAYCVLQMLSEEDKKKIPEKLIEAIKNKMDSEYQFEVGTEDEEEPKLLVDTEKILSVVYTDYLATDEEKKVIKNKEMKYMLEKEKEKQEKYPTDVFQTRAKAETMAEGEMLLNDEAEAESSSDGLSEKVEIVESAEALTQSETPISESADTFINDGAQVIEGADTLIKNEVEAVESADSVLDNQTNFEDSIEPLWEDKKEPDWKTSLYKKGEIEKSVNDIANEILKPKQDLFDEPNENTETNSQNSVNDILKGAQYEGMAPGFERRRNRILEEYNLGNQNTYWDDEVSESNELMTIPEEKWYHKIFNFFRRMFGG